MCTIVGTENILVKKIDKVLTYTKEHQTIKGKMNKKILYGID